MSKARMCSEAATIGCVLSTVEKNMQSLALCGPAEEPVKQADKGKHRSILGVNGLKLKRTGDKQHSQATNSSLKRRLRLPLTLVIPSSVTDDSTGDVALQRPGLRCHRASAGAMDLVEGVIPPMQPILV